MWRTVLLTNLLWGVDAVAAPRVGVINLTQEGLSEEEADAVAYDIAAEVAERIAGEAIAGPSMRGRIEGNAIPEGCEESPECGQKLATAGRVDEVLLLTLRLAGQTTIVGCSRVPRDPHRNGGKAMLRLTSGKLQKRMAAIKEEVATLYAPGSVVPYVEAVPLVPAVSSNAPSAAPPTPQRRWLWPVVGGAGAVAAVALAVVLGVALGTTGPPTGSVVQLR